MVAGGHVFEVNDDEIESAGAEELIVVAAASARERTFVIRLSRPAAVAEVLVPLRVHGISSARAAARHVVVAGSAAPRDAVSAEGGGLVFHRTHRGGGDDPLLVDGVIILHHVAHVADEGEVERVPVIRIPLGLLIESGGAGATGVLRVKLRVRQRAEREIRSRN